MIPVAIFARVSKQSQDFERQVTELQVLAEKRGFEVVQLISEKGSASKKKNQQRPAVLELQELARSGRIRKVLISEVSRLGRKPSQVHSLLEELTELGISIYIHRYSMETLLENGKQNGAAHLIFSLSADFARAETEDLSDRILSGLEYAVKVKGVKLGRKPGSTQSDRQLLKKYKLVAKDLKAQIPISTISSSRNVAKNTIRKVRAALAKSPELTPSAED